MKYLVLVSHGEFAKGLKTSLAMFAPDKAEQTIAVGLENGKSADEFGETFREALSVVTAEDSIVVLADIVGGSPLTTALNVLQEKGMYEGTVVLGGMNLPMALTTAVMKDVLDGDDLAQAVLSEAQAGVQQFVTTSSDDADDSDDEI